jgi:hypothetical protein
VPLAFVSQHERRASEYCVQQERGDGVPCALPLLIEVGLADDGEIGVNVGEKVLKVVQSLVFCWHHFGWNANRLVETGGWRQLDLKLLLRGRFRQSLPLVRDVRSYIISGEQACIWGLLPTASWSIFSSPKASVKLEVESCFQDPSVAGGVMVIAGADGGGSEYICCGP